MENHIFLHFQQQVKLHGNSEFYRYKDTSSNSYQSYSWNDVYYMVRSVAVTLLDFGFTKQSNIGIFSNNKPEWSIADYGIMGIGAVTVPFFGNATREQVKYIIDETGMELIFTGNEEQFNIARWMLDNTRSLEKVIHFGEINNQSDDRCISWKNFLGYGYSLKNKSDLSHHTVEYNGEDLATIIYTSGTSGEPKGVMLSHINFTSCFQIHDQRLEIDEKDISMSFLPLSHIFERAWSYYMMHKGVVNVFLENPRQVIDELPLVNPSVMCTVPRFFEKTYEGIQKEYNNWPDYKQKVFDWSIKTGHRYSEKKSTNEPVPLALKVKHKIANTLVLKKLRNIFGKNMRTMPCSGAAIRPDLLKFFHATGLFINYGYGATETTATVSCFRTDIYNFDSCGTIMPDVLVKITEKGEILVKGPTVFKGYYNKPQITKSSLVDGWYNTGDEGYLLQDDVLVMTDRINDIFKTSVGKYVSPQKVELLVGENMFIEQVIIFGDNRKYISALIVPSFENLSWKAKQMGITINNPENIIQEKIIVDFYEKILDTIQQSLAPYERIVKFKLLSKPFSVEEKSMTSTLKIRRKIIQHQFSAAIEAMYQS